MPNIRLFSNTNYNRFIKLANPKKGYKSGQDTLFNKKGYKQEKPVVFTTGFL